MPTKKGAGGRQQNYDSRGRYSKTYYFTFETPKISKREKARRKEEKRRSELYERASVSKDKYLFDVYLALEKNFPGIVLGVNVFKYDENIKKIREFDIIAKKYIIEIKGESVKKCTKQFLSQKKYCEVHKKDYLVFSPNINGMRKYAYFKMGIKIFCTINEMISFIKEMKK